MRLTGIHIKSFRAIRDVTIDSVENALILVGQNNTGKSTIIDALRVALGDIAITKRISTGMAAILRLRLHLN